MLGLPRAENMRRRLFAGLPIRSASASKPSVAWIRLRRIARRLRLSHEHECQRFVEQRLRKHRIALHPFDHSLLESPAQPHVAALSRSP